MPPLPLMVFAAGLGTRMAPLTRDRPKPMIPVAGRPLIDHALALALPHLAHPVVINLHYLGAAIETHLAGRGLRFSWEADQLLDTGGGLQRALPLLGAGGGPVLTLNSDAVWTGRNPLAQLIAAWDDSRMDALLLLTPPDLATGHGGGGDFALQTDGRIRRARDEPGAAVYLGAQILRSACLDPGHGYGTVFSLNCIWDAAIARGRAFGLLHQGGWCDVGHPGGIALAETLLRGQGAKDD